MKPSFYPRLINDPFSDPGLFIPFAFEKRALLFDLGDLQNLTPRDLLKVSHIFVTHTHMDHFIGFDHILRILLGREKELHLFGPPDFLARIEGKLKGYTWNLMNEYETDVRLKITEVHPGCCYSRIYAGRDYFEPVLPPLESRFSGTLLEEPAFQVKADVFDHRIPVLGFSLIENFHININKEALKEFGLSVGPWLTRFKKALYEKQDPHSEFSVSTSDTAADRGQKKFQLEELSLKIARISPGLKITYLTDIAGSLENREKAISLAQGSDLLFIEAAFLDCDLQVARQKHHLTARQAGEIASRARVRQVIPFHFSPRYAHLPQALPQEVLEAFQMRPDE